MGGRNVRQFQGMGINERPICPVLVPSVHQLGARSISDLMDLLANIGNRLNFKKENKMTTKKEKSWC